MTISTPLNAVLSDDAYLDRTVGRGAQPESDRVVLGGVTFTVLKHVDNPRNGYQGTIYQRVDTSEIVVAHRGTEEAKDALTDAGMVATRVNSQANDAIALTKDALGFAQHYGKDHGKVLPVTVTGHSLGGTLAQITAHHFGLKGETFNAFGAASLGLRIPSGGDAVTNHVMANDPVSAASPHYGKVVVYATQQEVSILQMNGYRNGWERFVTDDNPIIVATSSLNSHKLGNFLGDHSVLLSPTARALADRNQNMIGEYRDDISERRSMTGKIVRGMPGLMLDAVHAVRGPLEPGEPARGEQVRQDRCAVQLCDPQHPAYGLFRDARVGVHAQDAKVGRTPDVASDRLAGALAAQMHAVGGTRIDHVLPNADASRMYAVQGALQDIEYLRTSVDTLEGLNTLLSRSSERIAQQAALTPQEPQPEPEPEQHQHQHQHQHPQRGGMLR